MARKKGKKILVSRRPRRVCAKPLAVVTTHKRVFACCARKLGRAVMVSCPQVDPRQLEKRELAARARKAAAEQTRKINELHAHLQTSSAPRGALLPEYFGGLGSTRKTRRRVRRRSR